MPKNSMYRNEIGAPNIIAGKAPQWTDKITQTIELVIWASHALGEDIKSYLIEGISRFLDNG